MSGETVTRPHAPPSWPSPGFHVAVVDIPEELREAEVGELGAIATLLRAKVALSNLVWADVFGHDDFDQVPEATIHALRMQKTRRKRQLVALSGPPFAEVGELGLPQVRPEDDVAEVEVVGAVFVANGVLDNTHMVDQLEVEVHPDWRRQGVARALLGAVEQVARHWGATTLAGWGTHRQGSGPDALSPSEGEFSIAPDAATALAAKEGWTLAQCERHSTQEVPSEPLAPPTVPEGYELVQWTDHTPAQFVDARCRLAEAISRDAPKGELEREAEVWDAERLTAVDNHAFETDEGLTTAALHVATGELAGFTELGRSREILHVGWQEATVVLPEHRGHGLGLVLKQVNLLQCQQRWPEVRRIHTWNAGENRWMLAINDQLGYRIATVGGGWQKKL